MAAGKTLIETLLPERLEVNLFRGTTPEGSSGRIYGGLVIAQALQAAYETVEGRICHSLHCYFLRPGDPRVPIIFEVDRSRDGGSFTTRRVVAIQHGQQIFILAASFQTPEKGFEHQAPMPEAPPPEGLADQWAEELERLKAAGEAEADWMDRVRPIEIRSVDPRADAPDPPRLEPYLRMWIRSRTPIGDDPRLHQVVLAYASDMTLLGTAVRPHGVNWQTPGFQPASLDHAMWFHHQTNFEAWHLYVQDSPSASGGRGFNRGALYAQDGTLVASVAQEGLVRMRQPKA